MLDEIIERLYDLTEEQQRDVLEYIRSLPPSAKRAYPRTKIQLPIDVETGKQTVTSQTRDICPSGVFIESNMNFKEGLEIQMIFEMPGQATPFYLNGIATRVENSGAAVQFKGLSSETKAILNKMVSTKFPDMISAIEEPIIFRFEIAK